ncbi:MAG: peptide chain release factor N(5)-glutamine methyltransferase [Bacteroidales bacterium]|nr:peptide chain release factor N(5)-glutamine methyltransferase [Bacteroidales bacterium]
MNTRNLHFRSNRVRDILALFHEELDGQCGREEVNVFLEMLFEDFLGWNRVQLLTSKENTIDQSDLLRFHWALEDLKSHRPIQHIIGHTDFCGCRIKVSPDVLVPRPETEEMVQWVMEGDQQREGRVLDLCTGSGCVAIALKKGCPEAEVTAVDISEKALAIARRNAESNGVEVRFVQGDVIDEAFHVPLSSYRLIISNPPYVMERERAAMQPNVLDYDPALALFVPDDDPLRFYKAIAAIAQRHLTKDGLLVVEINEALADETSALLAERGFQPAIHVDFRGKPRWISAFLSL